MDEQVARFRADLEALTGGAPERLGLAVSGGPDSLALLLLADAAYPGRVHAATVDHGLRARKRRRGGVCRHPLRRARHSPCDPARRR